MDITRGNFRGNQHTRPRIGNTTAVRRHRKRWKASLVAELLSRVLVYRNRIADGSWNEIDVVPRQPAIRVRLTANPPLDVRQSGKHRKVVSMMLQWFVSWGQRVLITSVLGKPLVLTDRSRNVEARETRRFFFLLGGGPSLAAERF